MPKLQCTQEQKDQEMANFHERLAAGKLGPGNESKFRGQMRVFADRGMLFHLEDGKEVASDEISSMAVDIPAMLLFDKEKQAPYLVEFDSQKRVIFTDHRLTQEELSETFDRYYKKPEKPDIITRIFDFFEHTLFGGQGEIECRDYENAVSRREQRFQDNMKRAGFETEKPASVAQAEREVAAALYVAAVRSVQHKTDPDHFKDPIGIREFQPGKDPLFKQVLGSPDLNEIMNSKEMQDLIQKCHEKNCYTLNDVSLGLVHTKNGTLTLAKDSQETFFKVDFLREAYTLMNGSLQQGPDLASVEVPVVEEPVVEAPVEEESNVREVEENAPEQAVVSSADVATRAIQDKLGLAADDPFMQKVSEAMHVENESSADMRRIIPELSPQLLNLLRKEFDVLSRTGAQFDLYSEFLDVVQEFTQPQNDESSELSNEMQNEMNVGNVGSV